MPAHLIDENGSGYSLPTPTARDWKDSGSTQGNRHSPSLATVVNQKRLLPTLRANKLGLEDSHGKVEAWGSLTARGGVYLSLREWIMGWPIGWTALLPLATAKFQEWCDSHGKRSPDPSPRF
jgi:DNA (cytosine-5)-methyltransferase 1